MYKHTQRYRQIVFKDWDTQKLYYWWKAISSRILLISVPTCRNGFTTETRRHELDFKVKVNSVHTVVHWRVLTKRMDIFTKSILTLNTYTRRHFQEIHPVGNLV